VSSQANITGRVLPLAAGTREQEFASQSLEYMTRISRINRIIRPTILALSLAGTACTMQGRESVSAPSSPDLRNALELYRSGDLQQADLALQHIYTAENATQTDQRRALATAILIRLESNTGAKLAEAQSLLDQYSRLNTGPLEPEFYLLRDSLNSALNTSRELRSQHDVLMATRDKLDAAQRERRQLEGTLKKLRELSLE